MKQRFKVTSQIAFEQLESELNRLGYKWSTGVTKHARKLICEEGRNLPLVVYVYTQGTNKYITWGRLEFCREEIDATFEIGMNLFQDTDGSVHIVQVSKPLETKEPRYRYIPATLDEMRKDMDNLNNYFYENFDGELKHVLEVSRTLPMWLGTTFYKREEF